MLPPDELARLLALPGMERINVGSVEHHREGTHIPVDQIKVERPLLTRDRAHCDETEATMGRWDDVVDRVR